MFRRLAAGFLAVVLTLPALAVDPPLPATGIVGIWEGPLKVGAIELRLAVHLEKDKNGKLIGKLDSIDQGATGMPIGEVAFAEGKLTLGLPNIKAKFTGTLAADGQSITGDWEQTGKLPLELKRVAKASTMRRPQHPKPPYPYAAEEVGFENAEAKLTLAGTLTLPTGDGPFPAVVLISGSGPQDRDETILGHKPFLVLADHLTRNGFAVLRYDDRGVGKSTGKHSGATSADFATDALAAVRFLKTRPRIDPKRIGLMGHSEGGLIAPMVAAAHPTDVAFVVLLAGTGVPGYVVLRGQLEAILKASGMTAEHIRLRLKLQQAVVAEAKTSAEGRRERLTTAARKLIDGLSADEKKELGTALTDQIDALAGQLDDPWMHFFLGRDPRPVLADVKCPVLAVNGALDLQVLPADNLPEIENAVSAGGNPKVTTKLLPGLNHMFQETKTGLPSEYGQIEQTFAPAALEVVTAWLKANT